MKKLTLALLASTVLTASVQARLEKIAPQNAIVAIKAAPHLTATDLGGWDYASVAGWTAGSGLLGWMLSTGFSILIRTSNFGYETYYNSRTGRQERMLEDLHHTTAGKCIIVAGTTAATLAGAYYAYKSKLPHNIWTEDHENLLNIVLNTTTEAELLTQIDQFFFKERYSRPVAFTKLSEILEKLTRARDAYVRVDAQHFTATIAVINNNMTALNNAMLIIKAQPTWLTESNAHTLESLKHEANAQATAQNIQMLSIMASRR